MNEEVKTRVRKEINIFFQIPKDMQNKALVWDTFKAYMQGILISKEIYLWKSKKEAVKRLTDEIAILEEQHKRTQTRSLKEELDIKTSKLKIIQATQAAKSLMYARQQ